MNKTVLGALSLVERIGCYLHNHVAIRKTTACLGWSRSGLVRYFARCCWSCLRASRAMNGFCPPATSLDAMVYDTIWTLVRRYFALTTFDRLGLTTQKAYPHRLDAPRHVAKFACVRFLVDHLNPMYKLIEKLWIPIVEKGNMWYQKTTSQVQKNIPLIWV